MPPAPAARRSRPAPQLLRRAPRALRPGTRRAPALLAAALLMAGAAHAAAPPAATATATATAAEAEPTAPRIERVVLRGVESIDAALLRERMLTADRGWRIWRARPVFDEDELEADLERIRAFYRREGFYEAYVDARLEWNEDRTRVRITIEVDEGPPVVLGAIDLEVPPGIADEIDAASLLEGLPLEPGRRFRAPDYQQARETLLRRLADRGRPDAALEGGADVDLATRRVRVAWKLLPGPRVRIGAIAISGLERTEEWVVRKELRIAPGEPYSAAKLKASQRAIYALGLFRSVAILERRPATADADAPREPAADAAGPGADTGSPDAGADAGSPAAPRTADAAPEWAREEIWDLEVRVVERPPRTVRVGIGFGTEDLYRGQAEWLHRNLAGEAEQLSFAAKFSSLVAGAEARTRVPYFIRPDTAAARPAVRLDSRLRFERENEPAYQANRLSWTTELARPLGARWSARLGYGLERSWITQLSADALGLSDQPEQFLLSYPLAGLRWDSVVGDLDPRRGLYFDLYAKPVLSVLGSDVDYLKSAAETRGYVPWRGLVLALRFEIGTIATFRNTDEDEVPIFDRFFAGGSTSVRGFDYNELGPRDAGGDPLGGLSWAEGSAELRFPIWGRLGGVAFVDAGEVRPGRASWNTRNIEVAAGGGLRIATPVGPIRFDVGVPLDRPRGQDRFRIHASVGQAF